MSDRAQLLLDKIASQRLAEEGDYASHQEYADDLMKALSEYIQKNPEPTEQDYAGLIQSTIRRREWYEIAVLRDLGICDESNAVRFPYLRRWCAQAHILEGKPIPYNFLIGMAYSWSKTGITNNHKIYFLNDIPDKEPERPSPTMPKWLEIILMPFPDSMQEQKTFVVDFLKAFFATEKNFDMKFSQYFLACNEPNLLAYNGPLLRDMNKHLTSDEFDASIQHYMEILGECQKALDETCEIRNTTLAQVEEWLMSEVSMKRDAMQQKMALEIEDSDNDLF